MLHGSENFSEFHKDLPKSCWKDFWKPIIACFLCLAACASSCFIFCCIGKTRRIKKIQENSKLKRLTIIQEDELETIYRLKGTLLKMPKRFPHLEFQESTFPTSEGDTELTVSENFKPSILCGNGEKKKKTSSFQEYIGLNDLEANDIIDIEGLRDQRLGIQNERI